MVGGQAFASFLTTTSLNTAGVIFRLDALSTMKSIDVE